jgi:hypothetical protein
MTAAITGKAKAIDVPAVVPIQLFFADFDVDAHRNPLQSNPFIFWGQAL